VFGDADPHVPSEGRATVLEALKSAGVQHRVLLVPGEHAFMRDEGARYDPAAADQVWGEAVALFKRVLSDASMQNAE
jgi:carboxymethylenebutenolidase